ncbi:ABC transporter substrate-binding protein [Rhizomonospora bruguierae]|uniref:ABC transporter substrate-binding protein n=1 Tax=Rhizomonospora bruguierae TaxID=1581705 RepID=UPI001BCD1372|nr:ABC transporter substrate-binding protein [Micromonospora sp. NBRC 107566]
MTPRSIRAVAAAAALLLAGTTLAGCGDDGADTGSSGAATALRLGFFPNITHAPALVGVQQKLFEQSLGGTRLETKTFNAGPAAIEALFSGAIDATYIGPNPAINGWAQSKGEALRIIAGTTSGGAGLVVRSTINGPADLKGKKIATPQLGNTQDVALRYWLKENGLTADQQGGGDVSVLPQDNATAIQAFSSGAIDGAWLPEPHLSRLLLEQKGKLLVDEKTLWPGGQFVTTHLIVRTEFLRKYPETVKALLQGHLKALDQIASDPAGAQKAANEQIAALTGKPLNDQILAAAFQNMTFTADPVAASLAASAQHAEEIGLLKPVDLKGIYDLGPLNELLKSAGKPEVSPGGLAP